MGLDMYAWTTNETIAPTDETPEKFDKLHYWRKHPNLHGWMEQRYYAKGGSQECFNGVSVVLTADDLDELEQDIVENVLPNTRGFFFGESDGSETDDDLLFIRNARQALIEGKTVFYDASW